MIRSYTWGTDLGGSLQGAGGVGGLLAETINISANAGTYFCAFDGNGNVSALTKSSDGSLAAQYEYGPFGEVIRATGPMAKVNPFRFSTKYQDDETDLVMLLSCPALQSFHRQVPLQRPVGGTRRFEFVRVCKQ